MIVKGIIVSARLPGRAFTFPNYRRLIFGGVRIDRKDKNLMRSHLEQLLEMQKNLDKNISAFQTEIPVEEYKAFLGELKDINNQNMQVVSRYMVRKCNR